MSQLFAERLDLLAGAESVSLLSGCLHGIERECLRVTGQGRLAQTPHPRALGSALTHPQITTDYAEALLEFVTSAEADTDRTLDDLKQAHVFVGQALADELLWSSSMPCPLPDEGAIEIANYGSSLSGQVKYVYRRGLELRYGKRMQCIAGIHYNFSVPEGLWPILQRFEGGGQSLCDFRSSQYIALIRNFRRYSWLLMYLFGASPALDASFLADYPEHNLAQFDKDSFYLPYATSLRMSDLGYQSNAQKGLTPCYDELATYLESLDRAIRTPYAAYEKLGTKRDGQWIQLNTSILQIENEYYSSIRPKRVVARGERPVEALRRAGIEYVEVRCMDINPFLPLGIDEATSYFLNSFLLYCLLEDSPKLLDGECSRCTSNFLRTVKEGRDPKLTLQRASGEVLLTDWARELLVGIGKTAQLLDRACGSDKHSLAVLVQEAKVTNPNLLPSAQVLFAMEERQLSFAEFSLQQSRVHSDYFKRQRLDEEVKSRFVALAEQSLEEQVRLEQDKSQSLDEYIATYINDV